MEKQILDDLKELRTAPVKLVGTTELPKSEQLSPAMLDKAANKLKNYSSIMMHGYPRNLTFILE
ncbi:MAG: hypothetical protein EOO88_23370 [Pedobacter sp.]|nr:MAG: hypothetical protein EOO88_23370 [Pedobacter sp.]